MPALKRVATNLWRDTRSGVYYSIFKRAGRQDKKSLFTTVRSVADRKVAAKQLGGRTLRSSATFDALAERWLGLKPRKASSQRRTDGSLAGLRPFLGGKEVATIDQRDADEWLSARGNELSASSFNKERHIILGVLGYAVRLGLRQCVGVEVPRKREARRDMHLPNAVQLSALLTEIQKNSPEAAVLVRLMALSGMRVGEATRLRWADVDFFRNEFVVRETKNGESRVVPLFPALRAFLEPLPKRGATIVQIKSAKRSLATAGKAVGVPGVVHHDMRRLFTTRALEAGIGSHVIARWLGHKDGGVLVNKTYGHLFDNHSREMAQRMT